MLTTTHDLKTWPEFYEAVADGSKTFEVRKNDRDFKVGDTLLIRHYEPMSGKFDLDKPLIKLKITYVLQGGNFGVLEGFAVLGFEKIIDIKERFIKILKDAQLYDEWLIPCYGKDWESKSNYDDGWHFDENCFSWRDCDVYGVHSEGANWQFENHGWKNDVFVGVMQSHGFEIGYNGGDEEDRHFSMHIKQPESIVEIPQDTSDSPF